MSKSHWNTHLICCVENKVLLL